MAVYEMRGGEDMSGEIRVAGIPADDVQVHLLVLALLGIAKRIREEGLDVGVEAADAEGGDDA